MDIALPWWTWFAVVLLIFFGAIAVVAVAKEKILIALPTFLAMSVINVVITAFTYSWVKKWPIVGTLETAANNLGLFSELGDEHLVFMIIFGAVLWTFQFIIEAFVWVFFWLVYSKFTSKRWNAKWLWGFLGLAFTLLIAVFVWTTNDLSLSDLLTGG